jgi:general secretion pathway protein F
VPRFRYEALRPDGGRDRGDLVATDEMAAADALIARGLAPVDLRPGDATPWWQRDIGGPTLSLERQERFLSTLAMMLGARLPLPRAIRYCAGETDRPAFRRDLEAVADALEDGRSFAAALETGTRALPDRLVRLLATGERADRLAETAATAAEQARRDLALARELRAALLYPAILIVVALGVLALLMFYLAPSLLPVFSSSGSPAPPALAALAGAGDVLRRDWPILLVGSGLTVLVLFVLRTRIAAATLNLGLFVPGLRKHLRRAETLRLIRALSTMLSGGARLPEALEAAAQAPRTPAFRAEGRRLLERLKDGGTLSTALAEGTPLDKGAALMIAAGEEGDRLAETAGRAADALTEATRRASAGAVRLVTPVLTLVIGGGVAALMMSVIGAILDLNAVAL